MKYKKALWLILGTLILALSFNIFFVPYNIVCSGIGGVAILFKHLFNLDEVITITMLGVMFWLIGMIFLDKKDIFKSLWIILLFPAFVYLTRLAIDYVDLSIDSNLLACVAGGISFGFGFGLIAREGYFVTGFDIITKILDNYFKMHSRVILCIINFIIIFISGYIFGFEMFIYAVIAFVIYLMVTDKVILGIDHNKSFYIITNKQDEMKKFILEELGHGVTILKGRGAYSNEKKYILFVSIPTRDYYKLRDGMKRIDKEAFFVVSSAYEVGGGK